MFNVEIQKGCELIAEQLKEHIGMYLANIGMQLQCSLRDTCVYADDWLPNTLRYVKPAAYVENLYIRHIVEGTVNPARFELATLVNELLATPCVTVVVAKDWQISDDLLYADFILDGEGDLANQAHHLSVMHQALMNRASVQRVFRSMPRNEGCKLWMP